MVTSHCQAPNQHFATTPLCNSPAEKGSNKSICVFHNLFHFPMINPLPSFKLVNWRRPFTGIPPGNREPGSAGSNERDAEFGRPQLRKYELGHYLRNCCCGYFHAESLLRRGVGDRSGRVAFWPIPWPIREWKQMTMDSYIKLFFNMKLWYNKSM